MKKINSVFLRFLNFSIIAVGSFITIIFLCFNVWPSHAQTSEETVAYIIYTIENQKDIAKVITLDGASSLNAASSLKFKETSKSPAIYEATIEENNEKVTFLYSVTKIADCIYKAENVMNSKKEINHSTIIANFSSAMSLKEAPANGQKTAVGIVSEDQCAFKISQQLGFLKSDPSLYSEYAKEKCRNYHIVQSPSPNIDRANKALSYLRENYCKGKAF